MILIMQWLLLLIDIRRVNIYSTLCITTYFYIFILFLNNKLTFLNNKILIFLGSISYSFYLIHQEVGYILINKLYILMNSVILSIIFALSITIIIAYLMYQYIEKPSYILCKKTLMKFIK